MPKTLEELRELLRQEEAMILERDKEMRAKGFTHRVTWWNHRTGGDDTQADTYFGCDPLTLTLEDGKAWEQWRRILYECTTMSQPPDYKIIKLSTDLLLQVNGKVLKLKPITRGTNIDKLVPTTLDDSCPTCGANQWLPNRRHGTWWCRGCGSVKDGEQNDAFQYKDHKD